MNPRARRVVKVIKPAAKPYVDFHLKSSNVELKIVLFVIEERLDAYSKDLGRWMMVNSCTTSVNVLSATELCS